MPYPEPVASSEQILSEANRRRTFAIISHPDAGKTTLTEKFLLYGGALGTEAGSVKGKKGGRSATSDWMELEQQRGISITSTVLQFPYRDHIVNLLDTPGHRDFSEDTYRVLAAADAAIMVLDAAKGIEPQTLKLFEVCRDREIPILTFINKWDRPSLSPLELLDDIEKQLSLTPTPLSWPVGSAEGFRGVLDQRTGEFVRFTRTAGGSTMANRLTAIGKRVLILDLGDFVKPDALIQKLPQPDGSVKLAPPRSDEVLYRLYKDAGGQIAGGFGKVKSKLDLAIPSRRKKIPAKQSINVCQARVFGGGPYVNNAIHLPIPKEVYEEKWIGRQPAGVPYETMDELMQGIKNELGVNTEVTDVQISDRSLRFKEGCEAIGEVVHPLPVAMRTKCLGCGSDNSVDSFGDHVGGIHPYSEDGQNSFLVQAMHNPQPAEVSYRTTANRLRITRDEAGDLKVCGVDVQRIEDSGCRTNTTIQANEYVVAAGVGATTKLLTQSLAAAGLRNRHLGTRLTANVGTAMYAMYDKPIWPSGSGRPEPGVTQCFLVDGRTIEENGQMVEEPALENWFHFPGTVALALTGWFKEFACVMHKFNHLSMSGIVVPTEVRSSNYVDGCGKFNLEFDCREFEMLLRGMRRIARIYFAAAKPDDGVTLYLPTKSILMRGNRPAVIRCMADFEWALCEIRKRGPAFVNLLTTHPQGGASLGDTVDPETFTLKTDCGERIDNLTVSDATLFPAGCEINPQLTVKVLATLAAQKVIDRAA